MCFKCECALHAILFSTFYNPHLSTLAFVQNKFGMLHKFVSVITRLRRLHFIFVQKKVGALNKSENRSERRIFCIITKQCFYWNKNNIIDDQQMFLKVTDLFSCSLMFLNHYSIIFYNFQFCWIGVIRQIWVCENSCGKSDCDILKSIIQNTKIIMTERHWLFFWKTIYYNLTFYFVNFAILFI